MDFKFGNAIVGQSGGPTSAINATLSGVIRGCAEAHKRGEIGTLFGMKNGIQGLIEGWITDLSLLYGNEEELQKLENTPASALGSCRKKLPDPETDHEIYTAIFDYLKKLDVRCFFYIGGNDSMDTVDKMHKYAKRKGIDILVMGVPKTIDNDLPITDHTPGYGSAAKFIANTVSEIVADCAVYSVPAVTIVEIMGRDTGWLTAAAGLPAAAGNPAPDLIYFPEKTFSLEKLYADIECAFKKHNNIVIAVSEGIEYADGSLVGEDPNAGLDAFGHKQLSGACKVLASAIKGRFDCKTRGIELNLPQRCAAHIASLTDINESVAIGSAAVASLCAGNSGCVVAFDRNSDNPYSVSFSTHPSPMLANQIKYLPDNYINESENGITEAFFDYALPLIDGETAPVYKNGIIAHYIFDNFYKVD